MNNNSENLAKRAIVYFEPDNMLGTRINGDIETIREFYKLGKIINHGYSDDCEDGVPYTIKGLEIYDLKGKLLFMHGNCDSRYRASYNI